MDIPFEQGMLSPGAADMRPGERSTCLFPSALFYIQTFSLFSERTLPMPPTCEGEGEICVKKVLGSIWLISRLT